MTFQPPQNLTDLSIQVGEIIDEYIDSGIIFGSQNLLKNSELVDFQQQTNVGGVGALQVPIGWEYATTFWDANCIIVSTAQYIPSLTPDTAGFYFQYSAANGPDMYMLQRVNVIAGQNYEWSYYSGAHRCQAWSPINWFDSSGSVFIGQSVGTTNNAEFIGGNQSFSQFKRIGGFAVAPAGACFADFYMAKQPTNLGQPDSFLFCERPYFARCRPNQSAFTEWQPTRPSPYALIFSDILDGPYNLAFPGAGGTNTQTTYTCTFFLPKSCEVLFDFRANVALNTVRAAGVNVISHQFQGQLQLEDGVHLPIVVARQLKYDDAYSLGGFPTTNQDTFSMYYKSTLAAGSYTLKVIGSYTVGAGTASGTCSVYRQFMSIYARRATG